MTESLSTPFRDVPCNVFSADRPALTLVAEKWSLLVLHALHDGAQSTGALWRRIGGISEKMLVQTLKRLEEAGLIARESFPAVPPHVEYSLTDLGRSLSRLVKALDIWVEENALEVPLFSASRANR